MAEKFICNLSKEELECLYWDEGKTYADLCEILGVKSPITVAKVLHEKGINTNRNAATALKNRNGMSESQFKEYLIEAYKEKNIREIARDLNVDQVVIRRYFKRYNIPFKPAQEVKSAIMGEKHPNWKGGRRMHNGYVEVVSHDHPQKNVRNCVYEHQLIMEAHLGRYLKKGEVVHHINFCRADNRIENLRLMTKEEHTQLHARKYWDERNGAI